MRIGRNILNNMMMDNQRKNPLYQTIITDLAITGTMKREDAEMLLGYEIPDYLFLYDGRSIAGKADTPSTKPAENKRPAKKQEQPVAADEDEDDE